MVVAALARRDVMIEVLRAEDAELRRRPGLTSRSSSEPPGADGLAEPAPKSLRGRRGREPGGQSGQPGARLEQVSAPDEVRRHEPVACTVATMTTRAAGGLIACHDRRGTEAMETAGVLPASTGARRAGDLGHLHPAHARSLRRPPAP